jgi:endonuclease/exonuclease/phosphatase family metal-dependent hydrolase
MLTIPPLTESEKLEFGAPLTQANPIKPSSLIIASYNIRYARGPHLITGGLIRKAGMMNTKDRAQLVANNIRKAAQAFSIGHLLPAVDVLALQEADKRTLRAGGKHVAYELATQMNMTWVHAPAGIPRGLKPVQRQWWLDFEEPIDLHDKGDTGVAILSRVPLRDFARIDLPWHECPWRPRLAMAATIPLAHQNLRLFNVHVDPHAAAGGQLAQLETIVAKIEDPSLPVMIIGDFNTLSSKKCAETKTFLESHHFRTPMPTGTATWRGAGIRLHADWIYTRGVMIKRWAVARPLSVSDHWPIWAEVSL